MSDLETKLCPFCAEEIKAAAVKCKHCGEYLNNSVPNRPTAPTTPRPLPEQTPPPAPKKAAVPLTTPERTLWEAHPSYLSYLPMWIMGGLLSVVFVPLTLVCLFSESESVGSAFGFVATFATLGVFLISWAYQHRNKTVYRRTTHRVMCEWGVIGRQSDEVRISDITAITLKQPWADALLGFGNIELYSSGSNKIEVHLRGVPKPEKVREEIRRCRDAYGTAG